MKSLDLQRKVGCRLRAGSVWFWGSDLLATMAFLILLRTEIPNGTWLMFLNESLIQTRSSLLGTVNV